MSRRGSAAPVSLPHFGPERLPSRNQAHDLPPVQREPELVAVVKPHD